MKFGRKTKIVINIIACSILVIFLLLEFFTRNSGPSITTLLSFEDPYLCKKSGTEFLKVDSFTQDDDVYICGKFKSNIPDLKTQLGVHVYSEKYNPMERADFYKEIWISITDKAIPIDYYFNEGIYVVSVAEMFDTSNPFFIIQLEVKNDTP